MRGAIVESGVLPVEVKISIEIVDYLWASLFQTDKHAVRQQFGFKRTPRPRSEHYFGDYPDGYS